jgi:AraC family transcriptional regulator
MAGLWHRKRQRGDNDLRTPGREDGRTLHRGPYETCESPYLALFSWMEERYLQVAGPIREIYPNNPREVRPEEIVTEIMVPVR